MTSWSGGASHGRSSIVTVNVVLTGSGSGSGSDGSGSASPDAGSAVFVERP